MYDTEIMKPGPTNLPYLNSTPRTLLKKSFGGVGAPPALLPPDPCPTTKSTFPFSGASLPLLLRGRAEVLLSAASHDGDGFLSGDFDPASSCFCCCSLPVDCSVGAIPKLSG